MFKNNDCEFSRSANKHINKAESLKLELTRMKRQVTFSADQLQFALLGVNDLDIVEHKFNELETCWLAFESVHLEYINFLNDDSISQSIGFYESELEEYVERVYTIYHKAISSYQQYKSEVNGICIKMKSLLKRLGRQCDQYSELYNDPTHEKSNLLFIMSNCFQPILDDTTNLLYKLIRCKDVFEHFEEAVDTIVWRSDELKLFCDLDIDSSMNKIYDSSAQINSGQHLSNVSDENSSVPSNVDYSTDVVSCGVYPVVSEYPIDVEHANLSSCSETESHFPVEGISVESARCSPHSTYCEDPDPSVPSANFVSCYVPDPISHLNSASSVPMEQPHSAHVLKDNHMKYDTFSELSRAYQSFQEIIDVQRKQTDLMSDIGEIEHGLDFFDNSCHSSNSYSAGYVSKENCLLEAENSELHVHVIRNECDESTDSDGHSNDADSDDQSNDTGWTVEVNSEPNDATDWLNVTEYGNSLYTNTETSESDPASYLSSQHPFEYLSTSNDFDTSAVISSVISTAEYGTNLSWKLLCMLLVLVESFICIAADILSSSLISCYKFFNRSLQSPNEDETQLLKDLAWRFGDYICRLWTGLCVTMLMINLNLHHSNLTLPVYWFDQYL